MKKRLFAILLACLLLVCTACGAPAEEPAPDPEPVAPVAPEVPEAEQPAEEPEAPVEETPAEEPEAPVAEEPAEEPEEPVEEVTDGPIEEEVPVGPTVEDALAFVDQPLSDLIEAIGEPLEEYYEYSCSGPGDDGLLTYDGFIVFTYREPDGTAETVIDAEAE